MTNKTLEYYLSLPYMIELTPDEEGYWFAQIPLLKGCMTQGNSREEVLAMSLEAFWKQESRHINQVLHRLLGKKRFLLLDGEIIGVAEVNRRQRSHT